MISISSSEGRLLQENRPESSLYVAVTQYASTLDGEAFIGIEINWEVINTLHTFNLYSNMHVTCIDGTLTTPGIDYHTIYFRLPNVSNKS